MRHSLTHARATSRAKQGRRLAACGVAALLALCVAACAAPPGAAGSATPAGSAGATLYTPAGAVRASDGAILWKAFLSTNPATLENGVLYASTVSNFTFDDYSPGPGAMTKSAKPHLWAISVATGALVWQRVLPADNPEMASRGFAAGGTVLYQHLMPDQPKDKQWPLLALDAATGATKWQQTAAFPYSNATASADIVLTTSGGPAGATCAIDVSAFDANTGARVWRASPALPLPICSGFGWPNGYWIVVG